MDVNMLENDVVREAHQLPTDAKNQLLTNLIRRSTSSWSEPHRREELKILQRYIQSLHTNMQ